MILSPPGGIFFATHTHCIEAFCQAYHCTEDPTVTFSALTGPWLERECRRATAYAHAQVVGIHPVIAGWVKAPRG